MVKTITLDEGELTLSNNAGWFLEYRSQFGHDIVPVLMPLLSSAVNLLVSVAKTAESESSVQEILAGMDTGDLTDAIIELSGLQFADFIEIVWAMAKTADPRTPEPMKWVKRFEVFPVDVLFPEVFWLVLDGTASRKKVASLREMMGKAKVLPLMKSSLQASKED